MSGGALRVLVVHSDLNMTAGEGRAGPRTRVRPFCRRCRIRIVEDESGGGRRDSMGVFRSIDRPVYDDLMAVQIATAQAGGEGELPSLLGSCDMWTRRYFSSI